MFSTFVVRWNEVQADSLSSRAQGADIAALILNMVKGVVHGDKC